MHVTKRLCNSKCIQLKLRKAKFVKVITLKLWQYSSNTEKRTSGILQEKIFDGSIRSFSYIILVPTSPDHFATSFAGPFNSVVGGL